MPYDAILPTSLMRKLLLVHESIVYAFVSHQKRFPFKTHKFIGHMASSQADCVNLFLTLLKYPEEATQVLQTVKLDFHTIAVEWFDSGYRLEFLDKPDNASNDSKWA